MQDNVINNQFWAVEMQEKLHQGGSVFTVLEEAMQKSRACGHAFGSETVEDAFADLQGEVEELKCALETEKTKTRIRNEVGDVLFSLVNICQLSGVDFDQAVQKVTARWLERKVYMEKGLKAQSVDWRSSTPNLRDDLWQQAKKELKEKEEAR